MLRFLSDFINLVYPQTCAVCDEKLVLGEKLLCAACLSDTPKTNYTDGIDNPVAQMFWGRVELNKAAALFYFSKGSKYRKLLHKLKYKGQKDIGVALGRMLGQYLIELGFGPLDGIVPVPLHARRLRIRGYNQSACIADGLSGTMGVAVLNDAVERRLYNISQTDKGRLARWENVKGIFEVVNEEKLKNKHILLVDDVITTGATVEACATALKSVPGCEVSVCSLAFTG
jgi:ComF family protein